MEQYLGGTPDPFDYRINGATDIVNVYFRGANNLGGANGNDLFFDDIYINPTASDLTNPAVAVTPCEVGVLLGDVNLDGVVDFFDIQPFIDLLSNGEDQDEADITQSGNVDFFDIQPFINILSGQPTT